ncbi:MAG: YbaN family protein [Candidatus Bathyarchaeota archaeon]|nr:YbaN family protein [Candidatus Bathyarchaeota archaeon]
MRVLLIIAGTICLVIGTVGIFLPILPTTPLLLLAAACYVRSSPRLYKWLLNNRWFGEYIKNYREGKGIPMKTKIGAVTLLWVTIVYSAFFVTQVLAIQLVLLVIAVGVSTHIIRLPTFKKGISHV